MDAEILYPPTLLPLLVPFIWLPPILWWLIPLGILTAVIVSWRPRPWAIIAILLCLTVPTVYDSSWPQINIAAGNPAIWIAAFVAMATAQEPASDSDPKRPCQRRRIPHTAGRIHAQGARILAH